jgi:hypothetical protein
MGWRIKEWADCDGSKYADLHVIDLKALSRNDPTIAAAGRTRRPVVLRRCRCGGCCSGSLYPIPVVGLELLRSHPL